MRRNGNHPNRRIARVARILSSRVAQLIPMGLIAAALAFIPDGPGFIADGSTVLMLNCVGLAIVAIAAPAGPYTDHTTELVQTAAVLFLAFAAGIGVVWMVAIQLISNFFFQGLVNIQEGHPWIWKGESRIYLVAGVGVEKLFYGREHYLQIILGLMFLAIGFLAKVGIF